MDITEAFEHVSKQISKIPKKIDNLIQKLPKLTDEQKVFLDFFIGGLTAGIVFGIFISHLLGGI